MRIDCVGEVLWDSLWESKAKELTNPTSIAPQNPIFDVLKVIVVATDDVTYRVEELEER